MKSNCCNAPTKLKTVPRRKTTLIIEEEVTFQDPYMVYTCKVKRRDSAIGHATSISIHHMELDHKNPQDLENESLFCLQRAIMGELGESILKP